MADTQRVTRLLSDAFGFLQIFLLRGAISNVHCDPPQRGPSRRLNTAAAVDQSFFIM